MADLRPTSYRGVMLRAADANDNELLYRVFAASRGDLVAALADLDELQRDVLMRLQFQAQRDQYRSNYPDAHFDVIVVDGEAVGRLYVAPACDEIHLVDVTLLPEHRNRGIGRALLQDVLDEGARLHKRVTLHVEPGNPAARLYERLGFLDAGTEGVHKRMEWLPPSAAIATRTAV